MTGEDPLINPNFPDCAGQSDASAALFLAPLQDVPVFGCLIVEHLQALDMAFFGCWDYLQLLGQLG